MLSRNAVSTFAISAVLTVFPFSAIAQGKYPDLNGVTLPENIPNFGGLVWGRDTHDYPKPYFDENRNIIDGYENEYIKGWVVYQLELDAYVAAHDRSLITAHSTCYPESIPYIFGGTQVQVLQTPSEVVMIFDGHGQRRTIYLNEEHPEHVVPSWWGHSVGHYEGDTLVVDTIAIGYMPQAGSMGRYGTPHTDALHLTERWHLLREGEVSQAPPPEDDSFAIADVIQDGRVLRLEFTVEDPGAFHKPWTTISDYLPLKSTLREAVCAENSRSPMIAPFIPRAAEPDF
jgi:hypothetical protein